MAQLSLLSMLFLFFSFTTTSSRFAPVGGWTPVVEKRDYCYEDDYLLSFQYWIDDSASYCSSLLNINDYTTTVAPKTVQK